MTSNLPAELGRDLKMQVYSSTYKTFSGKERLGFLSNRKSFHLGRTIGSSNIQI